MNAPSLAKSSLLRVGLPLALFAGVVVATVAQADRLLGLALQGAFGAHLAQYESVWFDWHGNVVAKQVVLRPNDLREAAELRFERVRLHTPGWGFFVRNAFDRELRRAAWADLDVSFEAATETSGLAALLPEFGPVGPASGALFERAGCAPERPFTRDEIGAMGLSVPLPNLRIEKHVAGADFRARLVYDVPGSSRAELERVGVLAEATHSLLGEQPPPAIASERWIVRDQGFVPARNRLCAAQVGVEPREFPERHIEALETLLQRVGLAVDDNAKSFYRRFARSGGEMAFGGAYQPMLGAEEALDERDDGRALARMSAALERDTRAVPVVWRQVPVVGAPVDEPPAVVTEVVAEPTPVASEPVAPVETPPIAAIEPPVTITPPAVDTPAVIAPPVTPAVTEPPVSTPPRAPVRTTPKRITRVDAPVRRATLSWDDLARHRGRQVRLWTVHNPPRNVQLLDVGDEQARVRAEINGGHAEYTVQRAGFIKATSTR